MGSKKYLYISWRVFIRNIKVNGRIFVFVALFALFQCVCSNFTVNFEETERQYERMASTVVIADKEDISLSFFDADIDEIYSENGSTVIIAKNSVSAYRISEALKRKGYDAERYEADVMYHSGFNTSVAKINRIMDILSCFFLLTSVFIILVRKMLSDKENYIFMRFFGYTSEDMVILFLTDVFLSAVLPLMLGNIIGIVLNKILAYALSKYLLVYHIFNLKAFLFTEIIFSVETILVLMIFWRKIKSRQALASFRRRV